ncbi:hypothetical protein ACTMTJ_20515 [Phytohabitans sp. LJ34]|uniref:hypothetical protein n=1 Tax=Phytohabitans sp. LJ34 TaxID=3452217 RepID=UPI003F8A4C3B
MNDQIGVESLAAGPILSNNVPEPISYASRNVIALDLAPDVFAESTSLEDQDESGRVPIEDVAAMSVEQIAEALRTANTRVFPNVAAPAATGASLFAAQTSVLRSAGGIDPATASVVSRAVVSGAVGPDVSRVVNPPEDSTPPPPPPSPLPHVEAADTMDTSNGAAPVETARLSLAARAAAFTEPALTSRALRPGMTDLEVGTVLEQAKIGNRLHVHRSLWGDYVYRFQPDPPAEVRRPQLLIVESYRLSSFLGAYGQGRTLKTFSLLPGENTTISVKTFTRSESSRKDSSSVLDSFTKESSDDFENSTMQENSDKQASTENFEYHAEAEASAGWGWGSAKISGGIKGGSTSAREEFAKNVSNALQKHASKASSKRDVQINTSSEVRESSGEETSIVRQVENINVGRTLNFVFRQMNQEHISILHLVDVRVAYWTGVGESKDEVPLPRLDDLLERHVKAEHRASVRDNILAQLQTVFDYKDQLVTPPVVEKRKLSETDFYWRFRKDATTTYTDQTGVQITVPGVIVSVMKNTMRTEGVLVDAVLGEGNALDTYSQGLQETAVKQRLLENAAAQAKLDREALGRDIVTKSKDDEAKLFRMVFPTAVALPGTISVAADEDGHVIVGGASAAPGQSAE